MRISITRGSLTRAVLLQGLTAAVLAQPVGTAFTYQGNLKDSGAPANGLHDMQFQLFKNLQGGSQIGSTVCLDGVSVDQGAFMVTLDFGNVFDGDQRFLQVSVRKDSTVGNCASGSFTTLSPRQPLTAVPYALRALAAPTPHSLNASDGNPVDALFVDAVGNVGIGTTAPTQRLQVAGTVRSTSGGFMFPDGTTQTTAAGASLWSANGANISNTNAGNVGIGTAAPATSLHIRADVPVLILQDPGSVSTQSGYVGFWNGNPTETAWVGFGTQGSPHFSVVNARSGGNVVLSPGPGGAVSVQGNVRLGSSSEYFAAGGTENLRLLRGNIDGDGSMLDGSGFSSVRFSEGAYTITFDTAFAGMPSITATCHDPVAGSNFRFASIIRVTSSYFQIYVKNLSGDATNSDFSFCVIGPR